jgi:hypothetical protein
MGFGATHSAVLALPWQQPMEDSFLRCAVFVTCYSFLSILFDDLPLAAMVLTNSFCSVVGLAHEAVNPARAHGEISASTCCAAPQTLGIAPRGLFDSNASVLVLTLGKSCAAKSHRVSLEVEITDLFY